MKEAFELVWEVFLEFEAPDYTEEGIKEFEKTINDSSWVKDRDFYGAFDNNDKIIGVIATKDLTHIALFFVDGKYHRKGIGRKLYNKVELLNDKGFFTVNSSLYAHVVYKHLYTLPKVKSPWGKGIIHLQKGHKIILNVL